MITPEHRQALEIIKNQRAELEYHDGMLDRIKEILDEPAFDGFQKEIRIRELLHYESSVS